MDYLSFIVDGNSGVFLMSINHISDAYYFSDAFNYLIGYMKKCVKLNTKIARFPVKYVKLLVFIKIRIKLCLTKA